MTLALAVGCSNGDERPEPARRPSHKQMASRPRPALDPVEPPAARGELEVHVVDVGHGDAILVRCPDGEHQLLVDAGELDERYRGSEGKFKRYLLEHQPREDPLEVVVLSHTDGDAIGSMRWVLDEYQVEYFVDNGCTSRYRALERVEQALVDRPPPHYLNVFAETERLLDIDFCPRTDVSAVALRPAEFGRSPWVDDNSIVVRVDYGESSFLLMGDADAGSEERLLRDPVFAEVLDSDVIKVARHGASAVASERFLAAVTPEVAVISCGTGQGANKFLGEPRLDTVKRLEPHLRQRPDGPVALTVCDGEAERPEEAARKPNETGIFLFTQDPGEFIEYSTSAAIYLTTHDGNLVFASDGSRLWRRDPVSSPSSPHQPPSSDQ
jgi:beta-lactamase superfamily II metal-dependent hydrolase